MIRDELPPAPVAELGRLLSRPDDVGEEHRREPSVGLDALPHLGQKRAELREHAPRVPDPRDIVPPSETPISTGRSEPASSITARTSSIRASSVGTSLTRSETPVPRLSKRSPLRDALAASLRACAWAAR